jgi:general secretion pathway protein G
MRKLYLTGRPAVARGFSIIELLVVVVIIGLLSAFIIPNLLDSVHKAKQKRTLATIREVGAAWFSWLSDEVSAAAAGSAQFAFTDFTAIDQSDLHALLIPDQGARYAAEVPRTDAWGNVLDYAWQEDLQGAKAVAIRSRGRDGVIGPTPEPYPMGPFTTTDYAEDIVWTDGFFVRYPAGVRAQ